MAKVDYTWKDEDKGWILDLELSGTIVPYFGSRYYGSADGGYVEDVKFDVSDFRIKIGSKYHEVEVDDDMANSLENLLKDKYDNDEDFANEIDNAFIY